MQLRKNEDGSINIVQKIDRGRDLGHISIELGDFSMETLSQFPELINKVNFEKTKEIFTRQRVQNNPISTKPISYWSQSVPDKNAYSVTGNDATIMMMLRPNTAVQVVSQSLPNYVDMVQNVDPSFPSKLKSAVENSNRFYISATIENEGLGDVGVFTLREVDTNRIVYTLKEQNIKALDGNIQMLKQTPQILYTTMLMDIARVNYEVNSSPDRIILGLDPEFTNAYNKVFTTN